MADDDLLIRAAIRDELSAPLENIRERVEELGDEAARSGRRASTASNGFDRLARSARGMGRLIGRGLASAARMGGIALGALAIGAGAASIKMLQLASDASEIESAFNTVFGRSARQVDAWVSRMNSQFGIATHELRQAASMFGVFGKAADVPRAQLGKFSTSLAEAGLDLASFYNADPTETFLALRSGLSGEAEPLRKFGIFLSDATMQAEAAAMGLTGELTEQQKVMVRQRIIMKSLGDAQGDMSRTSSGWANQMRALKGRLTDAGVAGGTLLKEALLPAARIINDRMGPAVNTLNKRLDGMQAGARRTGNAISRGYVKGGLMGAVRAADEASGANGNLTKTVRYVRGVMRDLGTVLTDILGPALGDVSDALPLILSPLKLLRAGLRFAADNAEDLAPIVTALIGAFAAYKVSLMAVATWQTAAAIRNTILMAGYGGLTAAQAAATGTTWSLNAALMANPIGLVVAAVALLVGGLILLWKRSETARDIMTGAFQFIYKIVAFVAKGIITYWQFVVDLVLGGIQKLLEGIAWLDEKVGGKIPGDFRGAAEAVKGFRDTANRAFDSAKGKVDELGKKIDDIGRARPKIKITTEMRMSARDERLFHQVRRSGAQTDAGVPEWKLMGDTRTARGVGRHTAANLSRTLAAHHRYAGTSGVRITNALIGGGGLGRGSGDHQAGRALDVTGSSLHAYRQRVRAEGGYAEFHGRGTPREHVHAVPAGDTRSSMARRSRADGAGVYVAPGAIVVHAGAGTDPRQLRGAVRDGLNAALRDAAERSYR